ncbi:MAG: iron ABC transporter permease [Syntrophaceae bacterium]|nr:iron ABC transporter permease [Syntrophaceae bacterium]
MRDGLPAVALGPVTLVYRGVIRKRIQLFFLILGILAFLMVYAIAVGSYDLSVATLIRALLGQADGPVETVVWNIRLPRIMAAILSGWGLGLAGVTFQSLLKNPLASPSTLGISQGAAFGASMAIVVFGAGGMKAGALRTQGASPLDIFSLYTVTLFAFAGAVAATLVILALARIKKMSPEAIILAGVALSSLFVSGTILIQYFASEVEVAAVVFWTFGDVARSTWREIGLLAIATLAITLYFVLYRWDLNALLAGEETAKSLGVEVEKIRVLGMLIATVLAALVTCFHGVIAFLGLLAPHIGRRLIGPDHRLLIPYSCLLGALLLLLADTVGRVVVGSGTLPVGVLTSFMGAPLFLYLIWKGYHR